MDNQFLHDLFIEEIRKRIPQKTKMSVSLAEVLMIEKEAVYRRLRREVPFTFLEVARLCQVFGISVDNIIGVTNEKSRPFQLKLTEYYEPSEVDYIMMEQYASVLEALSQGANSEGNYSGNQIPNLFWCSYEKINRFFIFHWKYQYDTSGHIIPYRDVKFSERYWNFCLRLGEVAQRFKSMSFVLDRSTFSTFVDDIRFFRSINLITEEEKKELKDEILRFIDDLEMLATRGLWKNSNNPAYLYISNVHFDTNYFCYESENFCLSMITSFMLNSTASLDQSTYEKMKSWLMSSKRASTLISGSGEMQRILFFAKQREIVGAL